MTNPDAPLVERLLAERIGLDPATVGPALIARGVHARMSALGLKEAGDYERRLTSPGEELQALVEEIVIPESWFFRDGAPFSLLRDHAQRGWGLDPSRAPLTALSIPCAGGEEPYSMAITLIEAGLSAPRFRIDAVDVSARSVARAIGGVFSQNSFRGVSAEVRARHFRAEGAGFTIDPALRSAVRFRLGNLLDPTLFADRSPFDVVFCRNLLIYLDDRARRAAFATLDRLLAADGVLFLGHADRPDPSSPFTPTGDRGAFAYRKGPAQRRFDPPASPPVAPRPRPPISVVAPTVAPVVPRVSRAEPVEAPAAMLDRAAELADRGRIDEATPLIEAAIRADGSSARAFFLLGLARQAAGDREGAEGQFQKAVYLDADHDEALLALAVLASRRGDLAAEAAYRRRASRARARKGGA
jgi:chemotaxis protein methyltransferase WspC